MTQEPERLPHGFRERLEELFSNLRQGVLYLRKLIVHKLTAGEVSTDTISEQNSGSGVTIDGLIKIKDNIISTASGDLYVWAAGTLKLVSTSGEVWLYCNSPIFRGGTGDPVHEYRDKDDNKLWAILPATNLLTFSYWDIVGGSWQPVFTLSPTGPSLTLGSIALPDSGELTISSGVITVTGGWHTVDTENDDATDDLDTISGGTDGMVLFLAPENDARTVVVKHEAGNISCPEGGDLTLDDVEDFCILIYSGAQTKWFAVAGHAKYTDAAAVSAVATADDYLKNDANDETTGDLTVANLITAGNVDGVDVSALAAKVQFRFSITVEDPTSSEDISITFTNKAVTITEMRAVLVGTANGQTVTWTIRHHSDRSNAGNEVVTSGTATTSLTTGSDVTAFNDATIPADSFIWLETTAKGGTVTELHITGIGTYD